MEEKQLAHQTFLSQIPATKEGVKDLATLIVKSVLNGDENPLEIDIRLRYLAELTESVRKHALMKREVMDEAEKYPEKSFDAYGAKITKTQRTTYSYVQCNDSTWSELNEKMAELKDQLKRRETFLKGLDGSEVADPATGEIILPPLKESTDSLRVTLS